MKAWFRHRNLSIKIRPFICTALLIAGLVYPRTSAYADVSLAGTSGLITVPTADVLRDGEVNMGVSILHRNYVHLNRKGRYDIVPIWISLGYLPSLELSARLTIIPGLGRAGGGPPPYRDGMASLQWRVLGESARLPAVAIGARDMYGFALFNTLYLVFSKHMSLRLPSPIHRVRVGFHFGHGVDWMGGRYGVVDGGKDIPTKHRMIGTFGGIELPITRAVDFALEYDTTKLDFGVSVRPLAGIQIQAALLGGRCFAMGASVGFNLE